MADLRKIENIMLNPAAAFKEPAQVVHDASLTRDQKIEILRQWHYDAVRLQESAGENMTGGELDKLRAVSKALLELDVHPSKEADPHDPTNQPAPSVLGRIGEAARKILGTGARE
jgi:hypothetical protein